MNSRILLCGKDGQIGSELHKCLPRIGEVIALGRPELDLSDPGAIRRIVSQTAPQLIVNAAAFTAVDEAEAHPAAAFAVNAEAVAVMAQEARKVGAALVHYSTDYVFDGQKKSPYVETDPPRPINVYGRTKLAGEQALREAGVPYLIFRNAWVYATRGQNFLLTILRLATQNEKLRVVNDQLGAPTWSAMIAAATVHILEQVSPAAGFSRLPKFTGTYHLTSSGQTSRHGFAQAILQECSPPQGLGPWFAAAVDNQPLVARSVEPVATRAYPRPAQRPLNSVLSTTKVCRTFGMQLPHWGALLKLALREAPESVFRDAFKPQDGTEGGRKD